MPDWEELSDFLRTDDFAVEVLAELQSGQTRTFSAIFDEPYLNAQLGEYELDTGRPRLTCDLADVQDMARGDVVTVGGTHYDVMTGPQSDGTGMAMLDLAPQS